ncbi:hypothetical protein [Dyadobacter bucti]|uniref:hypothetical protein n=1 Tax=Dyadobacter bucti TaxID=2572203 RepID=UPI003F7194BE
MPTDLVDQDKLHPERTMGYYGGGTEMGECDQPVVTPNLTKYEKTSNAKKYNKEQFIRAAKSVVRPDGSVLKQPMFPRAMLSHREVGPSTCTLKPYRKFRMTLPQRVSGCN